MAPPAQTTIPDLDTRFLINALAYAKDLSIDAKGLAAEEGLSRADKAKDKLRRILQRYGYKYEGNKVVKGDGDGPVAKETLKKDGSAKKRNGKATPLPKKRKMEEDMNEEDTNWEAIDDGRVKEEAE